MFKCLKRIKAELPSTLRSWRYSAAASGDAVRRSSPTSEAVSPTDRPRRSTEGSYTYLASLSASGTSTTTSFAVADLVGPRLVSHSLSENQCV